MTQDIMIGLEVHAYLKTKEKLFCSCKKSSKEDEVNTNICPRCTGQPGAKPKLPNKEALYKTIKLGQIFGSKITLRTNFQRKQYTWPDMPVGYQRTVSGNITPTGVGGEFQGIGIEELHLEEDPAAWDPVTGEINYNRAGSPLAEIVTKPEFTSTDQLREWLKELILVASYIDAIDPNFNIKSDVNVSIKESGFKRVEIKNVNSFTNIVASAEAEIKRQRALVANGESIEMQTRRYNETLDETQFMRSKENAQDYMFIPEPDLPNLILTQKEIDKIKKEIPELPAQKRDKYSGFGLKLEDIEVLVSNRYLTEIFEHALKEKLNPKEVGLFLRREIMRVLNYNKATFKDLERKDIKSEISKLLELLSSEKISYTTAQKLIEKLYAEKFNIEKFVEENNLIQVQDDSLIEDLLKKALSEAPKAVEDYKAGNTKSLNFVVGIVMRETKGTASPQKVNQVLMKLVKNL
ncbi:MAG: Asp-tRNA(Asn)/Glu-tRNA(Gln) amidotransferase subunit GatB [Candidatus Woesearchaeota archaeon]|jgi:aspartyl-tRNA(Asn)/glutamyl-tRNA(Gln) amidotransferase subunit B|nr:Asp-tRNA(Asn)/Glu-tRNA(Gln) amidotransferase subunit GatB [Candidatus Woesearchaeota archaeon]